MISTLWVWPVIILFTMIFLASRILEEIDCKDCLRGSSLQLRSGSSDLWLSRFEEVLALLLNPRPLIDIDQLEAWIRKVMKDQELGDRIHEAAAGQSCMQNKINCIRDLMGLRLLQCRQTL